MSSYNIPNQNLKYNIPDEGKPFLTPSENARGGQNVYVLKNGKLYSIPLSQYTGDVSKLGSFNLMSGESQYALAQLGGTPNFQVYPGTMNDFQNLTPKTTSYTQSNSPDNPQGAVIKDSSGNIVSQSPSLAQVQSNALSYNQQTGGQITPPATQTISGVSPNTSPASNVVSGNNINQTGTSTGTSSSGYSPTGDPVLDATLAQMKTYLDKLTANGQAVNPNVEITPEQIAKFTAQAQSEIDPYYASQLKLARESLLRNAGYNTDQILQSEQNLERNYGLNLRQLQSNFADQGFALSGARAQGEQNLATDTQNTINQARSQLGFEQGNNALTFAQNYGSANLPTTNIRSAPTVIPGQMTFNNNQTTGPLYSLSPSLLDNLTGSQQYQENVDIQNRSNQLQNTLTNQYAANQQRQLSI